MCSFIYFSFDCGVIEVSGKKQTTNKQKNKPVNSPHPFTLGVFKLDIYIAFGLVERGQGRFQAILVSSEHPWKDLGTSDLSHAEGASSVICEKLRSKLVPD